MGRHQHYWIETGIPSPLVFINHKFRYDCSVCDKKKFFKYQPVNPVVPTAWDVYNNEVARGNAHLVMSPPVMQSNDQYLEGERYAKLIKDYK